MKWYWIVLIVAVVLFILYKLATRHPKVVQHQQNADGTSVSTITTPSESLKIVYDSNGNTQRVIRLTNVRAGVNSPDRFLGVNSPDRLLGIQHGSVNTPDN